jgi:hypothetical protein
MRSVLMAVAVCGLAVMGCLSGCGTLDKAYNQEVTWADAPTIHVFTNTVVVTNTVPVVTERTNVVYVTNATSGAVSGLATREPIATNYLTVTATNLIPVFMTNVVQVPVTNLIAKPEAEAAIGAVGSVVNTFAPGIGSITATDRSGTGR